MATVLLTWELGGGLGHLTRLQAVGDELSRRGHTVVVAVRDMAAADTVFRDSSIRCRPAPAKRLPTADRIQPPHSFAHILHNVGYASVDELGELVAAWSSLYDDARPDLVLADHSPTALLALRGHPARRATIGTGFATPPDAYPLPNLRPWVMPNDDALRRGEDRVLETINAVLRLRGQAPLDRVSQQFHQVDEVFLATFCELDYFGPRELRYYGTLDQDKSCEPIRWPVGDGPKVFAYLKPMPALESLLDRLRQLALPTIVVADRIDRALREKYTSAALHFSPKPLPMRAAAESCDLAILNSGHGTTAAILLAGKPSLHLPIYVEQYRTAQLVAKLGAGIFASPADSQQVCKALDVLLTFQGCSERAREFSERYARYDAELRLAALVDHVEALL